MDVVASSRAVRERIIGLMRPLDEQQCALIVPASPEWSVLDVLRHLEGAAEDAIAGRLDGVATERWTDAQVERLRGRSLSQLCDAWEACAGDFDRGLAVAPDPLNRQAVMDLSTHEHDLRHALGRPGAQDDASVTIGRQFLQQVLGRRDPELFDRFDTLGLDDFEVMRIVSGRRSARQIAAAGVEVARVEALIERSPFSLAGIDIVERA